MAVIETRVFEKLKGAAWRIKDAKHRVTRLEALEKKMPLKVVPRQERADAASKLVGANSGFDAAKSKHKEAKTLLRKAVMLQKVALEELGKEGAVEALKKVHHDVEHLAAEAKALLDKLEKWWSCGAWWCGERRKKVVAKVAPMRPAAVPVVERMRLAEAVVLPPPPPLPSKHEEEQVNTAATKKLKVVREGAPTPIEAKRDGGSLARRRC